MPCPMNPQSFRKNYPFLNTKSEPRKIPDFPALQGLVI